MPRVRSFSLSVGLIATILVAVGLAAGLPLRAQQSAADVITPPVRHTLSPPTLELPTVPAVAESLSPMTIAINTRVEQTGRAPRVTRQVVLRTVDHVLVAVDGTDSEWLFERNPIDHRRVSAYLVDHKLGRILAHQESDLRNGQQIRGWMDVLTLRFDAAALGALRATGEIEVFQGATFARFVERAPSVRGIADVWWSDALLLPRRVTTRDASSRITSTVESFEPGVDESKLAPPATRFPSYDVLDVTDAREQHSSASDHPRKKP